MMIFHLSFCSIFGFSRANYHCSECFLSSMPAIVLTNDPFWLSYMRYDNGDSLKRVGICRSPCIGKALFKKC